MDRSLSTDKNMGLSRLDWNFVLCVVLSGLICVPKCQRMVRVGDERQNLG